VDNSRARSPATAGTHQSYPGCPALRQRDERLEALKGLVDHLAHDFNNMLVPLLGYVTLIKEEVRADSASMKYALKIENSARNTEGMIERILTAVRPQRCFHPTAGDLAQVLEQCLSEWQAALPTTAQITVQTSLVPCPLVFDQALIGVLFEQVLSNARYALALGGRLEVSLRPRTLSVQRSLELNVAPSTYELVISDNGFGMSPDVLHRVCEPFFTTRPRGQALGLGLTNVHSIAQLHGGQLIVESTEDIGTTITIWLPTEQPRSVAATSPAWAARHRSGHKRGSKVLVVDDDPIVREVLKTHLQWLPVEVAMAEDGAEGLKIFQKNMNQFGLIVCDISMPKMNGFEFYENVRKLDPEVPVVWISGDPEAAQEDALARFGPKRPQLLRKPFTLKALMETIRTHLA